MTAVEIFEELRFIWELLAAEFVLLIPFARRKKNFGIVTGLGWIFFSVLSQGYFLILQLETHLPEPLFCSIVGGWYILLALLAMAFSCQCFHLTFSDALYMCITAYSAQHIVYVLIHELLALWLWPELAEHLVLYVGISLVACVILLGLLHRAFAGVLSLCGGRIFDHSARSILSHILLLAILMVCSYSCQYLFRNVEETKSLSALLGLMLCLLMLGVQYGTLQIARGRREKTVIEQMLRDSSRQYALSKELVEHIQRTCHDLKHNLQVLKTIDEDQRKDYIEEAERNIALYHDLIHTDNEVLNTILGEKCLYCRKRDILLTCAVDGAELEQISIPDLYAILGNAIENAIECVDHFDDPQKRVISLSITGHNAFVCIQTNNFCQQKPTMLDGLPVTTKSAGEDHGFGLKSIRYLAQKYGGSMAVSFEDQIFTLQIMLPK